MHGKRGSSIATQDDQVAAVTRFERASVPAQPPLELARCHWHETHRIATLVIACNRCAVSGRPNWAGQSVQPRAPRGRPRSTGSLAASTRGREDGPGRAPTTGRNKFKGSRFATTTRERCGLAEVCCARSRAGAQRRPRLDHELQVRVQHLRHPHHRFQLDILDVTGEQPGNGRLGYAHNCRAMADLERPSSARLVSSIWTNSRR